MIKPTKTLLDLKGSIKTDKKILDWEEVRAKAKEAVAKKISKSLKRIGSLCSYDKQHLSQFPDIKRVEP